MNLGNLDKNGILSPIGQIKQALKKEKSYKTVGGQLSLQDRTDTFRINQNNILMKILSTARNYNQGKENYLKKFINNYITDLTIDQDNELLSKLYYYLEVYQIDTPISEKSEELKLDNEILIDTNNYSKTEIMFELLFNNVYLPPLENLHLAEYKTQNIFNDGMLKLIKKLENRITKFRLGRNPVLFAPVSGGKILTYMNNLNTNIVKGVKFFDKGVIKKIGYRFALNERADIQEENEFYFSININAEDKNGFSKEEYIRHILEDLGKLSFMDGRNYYLGEDQLFRYSYYIGETFYKPSQGIDDNGLALDYEILGFEIRIYAYSKKDLNTEEIFDNVCLRMPGILEGVVTDIYETYGRDLNGNIGYPSKTEYFDVTNLLNAEEDINGQINELRQGKSINMENGQENQDKKYIFYKPEDINYSLEDLILEEKIKETLYEILDFFEYPQFYLDNNGDLFHGMVLEGPPGTGKTTLVKVLGKESGAGIFHFSANMQDSLVGGSEDNLTNNYKDIEEYIDETGNFAIAFIDEADTIFSARGGNVKDFKEGMISVQTQMMDGFKEKYQGKITFIFGTNRKEILDTAILSRCDKELLLDLPSEKNRVKILDLHIAKKMNGMKIQMYEHADLDLDLISKKIGKRSGRFIKNLISHAHNKGLRQLRKDNSFTMTNEIILESIDIVEKKENEKVMGFFGK